MEITETRFDGGGKDAEHLAALVKFFLSARRTPLPHFPKTAEAYCGVEQKADEGEEAFDQRRTAAATKAWNPSERATGAGESEDAAIRLLFGTAPPLSDAFFSITETIWEPLVAGRSKG